MIEFRTLTVEGFRSFKAPVKFKFGKNPGLNFMRGRNETNPRLGGNASGKSSLWSSLIWCIYGKTERGLKAGDIANWGESHQTEAGVEFHHGNKQYTLRRTWNPNSLTLQLKGKEPKVVGQERIDELFGSYESFLATVLMGQFNRFFFDLSPTEKLAVFSSALGLDYWLERAEVAKNKAKEAEETEGHIQDQIHQISGRWQSLLERHLELKNSHTNWLSDKGKQVGIIEAFLQQKEPELATLARRWKKQTKVSRQLDEKAERLQREANQLDKDKQEHQRGIDRLNYELKHQQSEAKRLQEEEEAVKGSKGKCPACGRKMEPEHFLAEVARIYNQKHGCLMVVNELLAKRDTANKAFTNTDRLLGDTLQQLQQAYQEQKEARRNQQEARRKYDEEDGVIKTKRELVSRLKSDKSPYHDQFVACQAELTKTEIRLSNLKQEKGTNEARLHGYQYWAKEFKRVRLHLIEGAVRQLEIEVSNSLTQLGLDGWEVNCAVQKQDKKGKVSRGFTVSVKSPESDNKAVKWECWSGGETQRLRIAGAKGLQSLITGQTGRRFNVEVWDEPTAHVNEEGLSDLLEFFSTSAKEERKQVWLVDHRTLRLGEFDREVLVIRDKNGSRLEVL